MKAAGLLGFLLLEDAVSLYLPLNCFQWKMLSKASVCSSQEQGFPFLSFFGDFFPTAIVVA